MLSFLSFALPLTLFLSKPSSFWNFDGVACAAALELGDPYYLFHGNHLLYGFFGFGFWKLISVLGPPVRALPALQLFTSILSALSLMGLYRALVHLGVERLTALLASLASATMAVVWVWSIEAQVYPLGAVGLAFGTATLFAPNGSRRPWALAGWHSLALLGHVMNLLWVAPALYWIFRDPDLTPADRKAVLARYLGGLLLFTGLPYLLVFFSVILPHHQALAPALVWLKGSAGLTPHGAFQWHAPGWQGPLVWAKTTLMFFSGIFWPYAKVTVPSWTQALGWISVAASVGLIAWAAVKGPRRPVQFALVWLGIYALFLWTWEPGTECYRMPDAIPVGLLLALGASQLKRPWLAPAIVAALAAVLLVTNLRTRIAPMARTENNYLYQQTLRLARETPPNSVYLTPGGLPWLYLLYFTSRSAYSLSTPAGRSMLGRLRESTPGAPVIVAASLLRNEALGPEVASLRWEPVAPDLPWLVLQ